MIRYGPLRTVPSIYKRERNPRESVSHLVASVKANIESFYFHREIPGFLLFKNKRSRQQNVAINQNLLLNFSLLGFLIINRILKKDILWWQHTQATDISSSIKWVSARKGKFLKEFFINNLKYSFHTLVITI